MEFYTFKAYGNIYTKKGENGGACMEDANRELLWSNPKSKDGAWFEDGPNAYHWIEGNFFD